MIHYLRVHINCLYHTKYFHPNPCEISKINYLYSSVVSLSKLIMATNRYCIDLAKRGTAGCKNCNQKIDKGVVRIAKIIPNPFTESGGDMKQWFHVKCMFDKLSRARATTKKIESTDDLEGWNDMEEEHRAEVLKCISEYSFTSTTKKTPQKKGPKIDINEESQPDEFSKQEASKPGKDDTFRHFRKLVNEVSSESSYLEKSAIMKNFFTKGSDGGGFKGDLYLWVKMLLPNVDKRVYQLKNNKLVKLFCDIFESDYDEMLKDMLEQGDVAKTISTFFEDSRPFSPCKKSTLTLQDVEEYLEDLSIHTKEAEQIHILKKVSKRCTENDLQMFVRLIKHDLRMDAGPKPVLDAINPTAYEAFQASRNLKNIVMDVLKNKGNKGNALTVQSSLMTPVLPMLAMACGSVSKAFEKCPNGFYVEIKYDGERVQVHKRGSEFSYFSRSLKPVMPHKVLHFKEFIPKAFPHGNDLILDSEILLVSKDGVPLPFGTLGAHRKTAFNDATVCLYVFDILQFNNENLMKKPLCERREMLKENMTEIKNRIMFSEMKEIKDEQELKDIINSVIQQGLEGLVIKDKMSVYEPGKRHWLKVKKDYLKEVDLKKGVMPDSADLVVMGAYYGTGKKSGLKSIFLMGCLDENSGKWCTVTKVSGFKDNELAKLNKELKMTQISKDPDLVPSTFKIKKPLVPDFIIDDIEESPVWEIIGTEFSKADAHTANGISIRFPRVKCIRDKTWKQSTTLQQLQKHFDISKQTADRVGLEIIPDDENELDETIVDDDDPEEKLESTNSKSRKRPSKKNGSSPPKKAKSESPDKNSSISSTNSEDKDLPNIFMGVKLYIPSSVKDADALRRYFIAYDGTLLKENQLDEANIVIESDEINNAPKNVERVSVDWLWACIKLKKRLPTNPYK